MARSGSHWSRSIAADDVRRLLEGVNALRVAIPIDRPAVLAGRLLALLEASVVAIDGGPWHGDVERLATAAKAPGLPKWTAAVEPVTPSTAGLVQAGHGGHRGTQHDVRLLPAHSHGGAFADVRPAGVRSVLRIGPHFSAITAWRASAFNENAMILLELIHPEVAWIFEGAAGRTVPASIDSVLRLMLEGRKEKEIATELGKSEHTVHAHVKRVYRHFGVNSRSQLLVRLYGLEKAE